MPQEYAEEDKEKSKKKKWWGDLFKRRNKKVSDSSSDEDENVKKKGFLSRRKKHDRGSKDVTNYFLINPGIKENRGRSLDSVSTGSGKKRVKAKVEASREQLAKDSSSDDGSSYTSSIPSVGSFPRRSRAARTERHNRRLWSASVVYQESSDYDTKYRAKTRSATPSPAASPKIRQRAVSQDTFTPVSRRMESPKYQPPVYTAPALPRIKPRFIHHVSDPVIPIWEPDERKPPAPPKRIPSEEKRRQANLEEALNELEAIYKKLEDLQDPPGEEVEHRMTDDMAWRRLNKREPSCQDVREIMSQTGSYLLVSPTLSPPPLTPSSPTGIEPDITFDDVVYRSINHANNTLKISDPQPPFGIPVGPISPAASSDYLHAKPEKFEQDNQPDIVRDDLAFRNLRKDSQDLKKKKAVRSMSANLSNVIQNNLNNEKSQSYSSIPEEMRLAQRVLDMRKKNSKRISNERLRQQFFVEQCTQSETDLLQELEDEARATSLQLEQQLKTHTDALYSRSMTDLLKELTKNLDYDFGETCTTCGEPDPKHRDFSNNNCVLKPKQELAQYKTPSRERTSPLSKENCIVQEYVGLAPYHMEARRIIQKPWDPPKPKETLEELCHSLAYESPRMRSSYRPEMHSSLKIKPEVKPFKGRSESYHGQRSPNLSYRANEETHRWSPQEIKTSPKPWMELNGLRDRSRSPNPWQNGHKIGQTVENRQSPKIDSKISPARKSPWLELLNEQKRDRSRSPKPWPIINGAKSLDETTEERSFIKPRWNSMKDRPIFENERWNPSKHKEPESQILSPRRSPKFIPERASPRKNYDSSESINESNHSRHHSFDDTYDRTKDYRLKSRDPSPISESLRERLSPNRQEEVEKLQEPKIKYPAPWRRFVDQPVEKCYQENGIISSSSRSPKPWHEVDQICQNMQTGLASPWTEDTWVLQPGPELKSPALTKESLRQERRCPTPIDVAAMEAESDEEKQQPEGLSH